MATNTVESLCDEKGHAHKLVGKCECGKGVETPLGDYVHTRDTRFYAKWASVLPFDITDLPAISLTSPTVRAPFLESVVPGSQVYLKLECALPTGSTKDRAALGALGYLYQAGIRHLAISSTGNTSVAFINYVTRFPELQLDVFVGKDFAHRIRRSGLTPQVRLHVVDGPFTAAGSRAAEFAASRRIFWEAGFFNPGRRDGLKTAYLEAVEQLGFSPTHYVQAVSSAMGVVGVDKAASELMKAGLADARPKLVCVQQTSCAPMVKAWAEGKSAIEAHHIVANPDGIAQAILRGNPQGAYPIVHELVTRSGGDILAVNNSQIRAAQVLVKEQLGVSICEASAAAVAGYLRFASQHITAESRVLINITGSDRNQIA